MGNRERVAVVLGVVMMVGALVLLLSSTQSAGADCGSVVSPETNPQAVVVSNDLGDSDADVASSEFTMVIPECSDARQRRLIPAVVLGVVGLIWVLWGIWRPAAVSPGEPA